MPSEAFRMGGCTRLRGWTLAQSSLAQADRPRVVGAARWRRPAVGTAGAASELRRARRLRRRLLLPLQGRLRARARSATSMPTAWRTSPPSELPGWLWRGLSFSPERGRRNAFWSPKGDRNVDRDTQRRCSRAGGDRRAAQGAGLGGRRGQALPAVQFDRRSLQDGSIRAMARSRRRTTCRWSRTSTRW